MLSVKHITLSGEEFIYPTPRTNFVPANARPSGNTARDPDGLWIYDPVDGRATELTGGTIFVMNDLGKTVSRYDLGASMVPLEADAHGLPARALA